MRTHGMGDFDTHMAKTAQTDDSDLLPRTRAPMLERRVSGNTRAQQGGHARQFLAVVTNVQDEGFLDHDGLRIATVSIFPAKSGSVVGTGKAILAILLLPLVAGGTMSTTID